MEKSSNCLSYWFPRLEAMGVPVPQTKIIHYPGEKYWNMVGLLEGREGPGFHQLVASLQEAGTELGHPCFLRTGVCSGKHSFKDTCYIATAEDFPRHVLNLVEESECAGLMGLPYDVWVVREYLPPVICFSAFRGKLPICKERRAFISNGKVISIIPYWPEEAIHANKSTPDGWREILADFNTSTEGELGLLRELSERVARGFADAWSLDWMHTLRGWVAIDMALAKDSWGCPDELADH